MPVTPKQRLPELEITLKKRQGGTGSIVHEKSGLAIRWPEYVILDTGERRRKMRYELLGPVSGRKASEVLTDRIAQARRDPPKPPHAPLLFEEHVARWQRDVLDSVGDGSADLYKFSVQKTRTGIIQHRLIPRFGSIPLLEISEELVQEWIKDMRREELRASTIHNYHKVLRVILDAAVTWKRLPENPCEASDLPKLKGSRKKQSALTAKSAGELLGKIHLLKPRAMVALAITGGLRRGELLALRWKHLDAEASEIAVMEASYRGHIDTPKTDSSIRRVPLDQWTMGILSEWRRKSKHVEADDFMFCTRTGSQETPGNILRRYVWPACAEANLPKAGWNTFRRTFSSLLHKEAIPAKTIADMMGHAKVDTQFIYIQGEDQMKRVAATKIGDELSRYTVQKTESSAEFVN